MEMKKVKKTTQSNVFFDLGSCILGIYICYLSYGIFQERIFKSKDANGKSFQSTFFLLCVQCFTNALIAFLASLFWSNSQTKNKIPFSVFSFTAFTYLGAMLCSNEALKHVSYPTQALGKSCKMIPVMLMGVLLRKKKYSPKEYACVFLITLGITVFQYGKINPLKTEKENSFYGLFLLFLSLTLDGLSGPKQEELSAKYKPTVHQQMLYTNVWAFFYTFAGCLVTGQGIEGFIYCYENKQIWADLACFSICSALGQNFIFFTIQRFSALACTTITTTRKFFTILCSVVLFGNKLTSTSWAGVAIVFTGLIWEVTNKYQKHKQSQKKK